MKLHDKCQLNAHSCQLTKKERPLEPMNSKLMNISKPILHKGLRFTNEKEQVKMLVVNKGNNTSHDFYLVFAMGQVAC